MDTADQAPAVATDKAASARKLPRAKSGTRRRKSLSDKQIAILEVIRAFGGVPAAIRRACARSATRSGFRRCRVSRISSASSSSAATCVATPSGRARWRSSSTSAPSGSAESRRHHRGPIPVGDAAMVPLVGRIAAGIPITAEQQIDEVFPLPRQLVGKGELFMLKVSGESMIDAAICDGDWIVVRQQKHRGERRHRRGDARRGGHRQGVPAARRAHLAAPAQHELRADPGRPLRSAGQGRRGVAGGLAANGRLSRVSSVADCRAPDSPAVAPRAAR